MNDRRWDRCLTEGKDLVCCYCWISHLPWCRELNRFKVITLTHNAWEWNVYQIFLQVRSNIFKFMNIECMRHKQSRHPTKHDRLLSGCAEHSLYVRQFNSALAPFHYRKGWSCNSGLYRLCVNPPGLPLYGYLRKNQQGRAGLWDSDAFCKIVE